MNADDIEHRFTYHPPVSPERTRAHQHIRKRARTLALELNEILPDGREKSLAITKLEEAVFWSNAALARAEPEPLGEDQP